MADESNPILAEIKAGKVDAMLVTQAGLGMAYAGHDWDKYKESHGIADKDGKLDASKPVTEQQRADMEILAHHALRETPLSAKDAPEYNKKGAAGYDETKPENETILDAQINSYIQRSYALDETQHVEKGTNLRGFLNGIDDAGKKQGITDKDFEKLNNIDFDHRSLADNAYLMSMQPKVGALKTDINNAAADHIDPKLRGVSFEQDLINTVRADDEKEEKDKQFSHAKTDHTKSLGGGIMELILMFIGALLGIDIGGMLGGGGKEAAASEQNVQKGAHEHHITFEEFNKHLSVIKDTADHLHEGKGKDGKPITAEERNADVKIIEKFAGIKEDRPLTEQQAKDLGDKVSKDIDQVRSGKMAVGDLGKDIDTITEKSKAENQKQASSGVVTELAVTTAALGPIGGATVTGAIEVARGTFGTGALNFVTKTWDQVAAFAGGMPKNVATGPDHSHAPGGTTGDGPKGGNIQVANAKPEAEQSGGRH